MKCECAYTMEYSYRGKKKILTLVKFVGFVWLFVLIPLTPEGCKEESHHSNNLQYTP